MERAVAVGRDMGLVGSKGLCHHCCCAEPEIFEHMVLVGGGGGVVEEEVEGRISSVRRPCGRLRATVGSKRVRD